MPVSESKKSLYADSGRDALTQATCLLDDLPPSAAVDEARREADAIKAILAPLRLPDDLQAAVTLYPAVREGVLDQDRLRNGSAPGILELANGLCQLADFALAPDWQPGEALAARQSEALRKMMLSVVSDVRLVLVRIGEQLFRLREAKSASRKARRSLAIETREIVAPLANRLGVWQLKWELEDLAFRYLEPDRYREIAASLKEKRTERETFIERIKATLSEELLRNGLEAEITGRPKHIYSIWRKMQQKNRGLEHIFDMRAVRILVDDISECYAALGVVHNKWSYLPGEFDDYIANPKDNHYQSLHTAVIGPEGKTIEIQIRTRDMHQHAELGVAAHWQYKEGTGPTATFDRKIRFLRQMLEPGAMDSDLLEQIHGEVFDDRVYAVSPKGDVVELPAGATPLDFAYHVHTQVGHTCRGAKVNGRIVPLTYQVQNGDRIEVITGKVEQPSRDWLNPQFGYLAASRSRAKVRSWFRHRDKDQNKRQGKELLERELSRLNVQDVQVEQIVQQLKFKNYDAFCVALGAGDITTAGVASAIQNLRGLDPGPVRRKRRSGASDDDTRHDIAISGVGDLLYNFAKCCRPVPPENIGGYITVGRGVSIHRKDCGNYLNLHQRQPERTVEVNWGEVDDARYPARLSLQAFDRHGLLRDVSSLLADEDVDVNGLNTRVDQQHQVVEMDLDIGIAGLPALSRLISRLSQLPNVTSVQRKN